MKRGKVMVKNGKVSVEMRIKKRRWVREFKVGGNGGYVDTRVV